MAKRLSKRLERKMEKLLVICGPTAMGKSELAVILAQKFSGEIISADSRQIYRGMDIGTGKITTAEMQGISHHLLSLVSPKRKFTVVQYAHLARPSINRIIRRKRLPIICGGSGFYIQALIDNPTIPKVPPDWRLRKKLESYNLETLQKELINLDKQRWELMDKSDRFNPRRLIRSLEVIYKTGHPVPFTQKEKSSYDILMIGLVAPSIILKEMIKKRLLKRLDSNMIDEVRRLQKNGVLWKRLEELGLEYRWIAYYLQNKISYEQMAERLFFDISNYARRQMTWFRKDPRIRWFDITSQGWENKVEKTVSSWYTGE